MKCTRHLVSQSVGAYVVVVPAWWWGWHSGAIVVVLAQWDKGTAGADLWFKSVPSTKTSGEVLINRCTFNFAISHRCWRVVGCAIETDDVPDSILAPQEPNIMDCTYPSHLLYAAFLCILTKYNISVHFNKMQYFSMYYIVMQQCSLRMFDTMWCVAMQHCAMDSVVSFKELHHYNSMQSVTQCSFSSHRPFIVTFCTFDYHQWGSQLNICNHPGTRLFEHIEQTSYKDLERMCYFVRLTTGPVSSTLYN